MLTSSQGEHPETGKVYTSPYCLWAVLHAESSKYLAPPSNTQDRKHLLVASPEISTIQQSSTINTHDHRKAHRTDHAPGIIERAALEWHNTHQHRIRACCGLCDNAFRTAVHGWVVVAFSCAVLCAVPGEARPLLLFLCKTCECTVIAHDS